MTIQTMRDFGIGEGPDLYRRNPFGYSGIDGFLRTIDILVDGYRLQDRQIGQPIYTILACEAGGMVPQLAREAGPLASR